MIHTLWNAIRRAAYTYCAECGWWVDGCEHQS